MGGRADRNMKDSSTSNSAQTHFYFYVSLLHQLDFQCSIHIFCYATYVGYEVKNVSIWPNQNVEENNNTQNQEEYWIPEYDFYNIYILNKDVWCVLRKVSKDKILCFTDTLIIIIMYIKYLHIV